MLFERKVEMKKFFSKKFVALSLMVVLIFGSTKAFAASGSFNNIINLIKNAFAAKTESVLTSTEQETNKIEEDSTNEIKDYIDNSYSHAITDIEVYKNSEISRGKDEINAYVNDFKSQIDTVITEEKGALEQKITDKVNKDVDKIKKDLDKDIEKYLKDLSK